MSGGSPPVKNASRSPSGADPRYLAMQKSSEGLSEDGPPIDAEGSAHRLRVGDDGVRAVHGEVVGLRSGVADARERRGGDGRGSPRAALIEEDHAMGLGGVRDPSTGLDRAASLETGAALEVEKVRKVRARGRVRLGRGDHLAREDLEGGGGGGVGVVQRNVEEVVSQLEAAHAEHVAHAVRRGGGGGGHDGLVTRGRVEGMKERGWRWVSAASTWDKGKPGTRVGVRTRRRETARRVPAPRRRRRESRSDDESVERARRAAWRTCGAARSGPQTSRVTRRHHQQLRQLARRAAYVRPHRSADRPRLAAKKPWRSSG